MPISRNISDEKNNLRIYFKNKRLNFTQEQKNKYDEIILHKLTTLYQYRNADIILTYVSKDIEVDTLRLIKKSLSDGKRVAVPRCINGTREMDFYFITSVKDLEKGSFGVLEPKLDVCKKLINLSKGFCIVPGISFDTGGFRLGYGKGYYDRFLSKFGGETAGICYSNCIKWNLPRGKFDKPVDVLVTEKYIRRNKKEE